MVKMSRKSPGNRILIVVENLPVPNDRRVWLEATTLRQAGYFVSVISIKGLNATRTYEMREGIHIYRYPAPPQTRGFLSFVLEFAYCWVMTFVLSLVVAVRHGFDVLHACNPPETFWLMGLIYKCFGKKFIFDHHDLSPEMYLSRFGKRGAAYKVLLFLEYLTFRTADVVITTNDTHRSIAVHRGKFPADKVFVVRSGPDHTKLQRGEPTLSLLCGYQYMVCYLGVLNPQDGVDTLLYIADHIVNKLERSDILFVIMGTGDSLEDLQELSHRLGLAKAVRFTGWAEVKTIVEYLSTCHVCVDTMPKNPYSDAATLNKIIEYMSASCPIVAFDLTETRISAGDAAVYAAPDNIVDFAENLLKLLQNADIRQRMGQIGRKRVEEELAWEHQKSRLLAAYAAALPA